MSASTPALPAEEHKEPYWRKRSKALQYEVFLHYCGGKPHCQCPGCRVRFFEFLQLDHVNGNGNAHRKENKLSTGGAKLWAWVKANGYPPGFQVLCRNCNGAKFNRPRCPLAGEEHY